MIRLFYFIIFGHHHKWTVIDTSTHVRPDGSVKGFVYHLQCEHCGNIKQSFVGADE